MKIFRYALAAPIVAGVFGLAAAQAAAPTQVTVLAYDPGAAMAEPATDAAPPAGYATAPDASVDASGPDTHVQVITNGPVPDTQENRAKYGMPLSHAGRLTGASGD